MVKVHRDAFVYRVGSGEDPVSATCDRLSSRTSR